MKRYIVIAAIVSLAVGIFPRMAISDDVPRMPKETLKSILDTPDLAILDVRYGKDWKGSDIKIKGAIQEDPEDVKSWADKYPKDKILVLYCA